MGTAKLASAPPVLVFVAVVVAFAGWVAYQAIPPKADAEKANPIPAATIEVDPPADAVLGAIQLGMPRLDVERQVAVLKTDGVDPIDLSTGSPICRSRFRGYVKAAFPHLNPEHSPDKFKPGTYTITFEFDGKQAGHPLIRVQFHRVEPGK